MRKLTPISKTEAESILASQKLSKQFDELKASIPLPKDGKRGEKGERGAPGKDGVTTIVTKEVLANKEMLLEKDEFEEFRDYMVKMEQDIRNSLAQTQNYFGGGGVSADLLQRIEDLEMGATYDKLIDVDGDFTYIGEAEPGTSPSASSWRIKRVDETNTPDTEILWANGNASFNKTWDNRAGYTY